MRLSPLLFETVFYAAAIYGICVCSAVTELQCRTSGRRSALHAVQFFLLFARCTSSSSIHCLVVGSPLYEFVEHNSICSFVTLLQRRRKHLGGFSPCLD